MKYTRLFSSACICALILSGCHSGTADYESDHKQLPAAEDIVVSAHGEGDYGDYDLYEGIPDLMKASDLIVYGEVTDFEMSVSKESSMINTFETIHIIETLYGDTKSDTDITLLENGGYMRIKDFLNEIGSSDRNWYMTGVFKDLTDEEINQKYYAEVAEGYYYPVIGERAVFCLHMIPGMDGVYHATGAWQGIYRETSDGKLAKPTEGSSLSDPDRTGIVGSLTLEELKENISVSAKQ